MTGCGDTRDEVIHRVRHSFRSAEDVGTAKEKLAAQAEFVVSVARGGSA